MRMIVGFDDIYIFAFELFKFISEISLENLIYVFYFSIQIGKSYCVKTIIDGLLEAS